MFILVGGPQLTEILFTLEKCTAKTLARLDYESRIVEVGER